MPRTEHVQIDELQIYLRGQAQPEAVTAIGAHLQGCSECQNRLAEGARFGSQVSDAGDRLSEAVDKRAESRYGIEDILILQPLSSERLIAKIIDISKSGLAIVTSHNLSCGTSVRISIGRRVFIAEVRYCRPSGADFQIGLSVQNTHDAEWTWDF
jgi:predicted anti-sigma-YlaC factor YlaD